LVGRVAATEATVLISGASGTGKELIAEAIHRNSRRRSGAFVKVNLGAIPASLFESEMFGHVRGAFTNAHQDRLGRFAAAQHGTILLDEVGELDPTCQVKLLRVLQDRTYEPVGSSQTRTLDIRVLAATNQDLESAVRTGAFREDLFYRLNLIHVRVPSLAERRQDIGELCAHVLRRAAARHQRSDLRLAPAALRWLESQPWPGNIRQLEHVLERAVLVSESDLIQLDHVRPAESDARAPSPSPGRSDRRFRAGEEEEATVHEVERALIERSLRNHRGNLSKVADSLGISRQALYRRLAKYGIKP
jgi:DNA-binding NtrC family response regulator